MATRQDKPGTEGDPGWKRGLSRHIVRELVAAQHALTRLQF
jgi:hypothetical protein